MAKTNNIDIDIFMALKASEKSKVPVLFLGNPGIGKSTAVAMFCEIRGYELLVLRGSSSSPEEILGYDVANETQTVEGYAKKLYPSWYKVIMENEKIGKKTLLFLDELTTCNEFTQSAMLDLIFSRRLTYGADLPEDCLIVSAGNYFANLSSNFNMLPPTLNRFDIINLTPTMEDLDVFLSKYTGSISGKRVDIIDTLRKDMLKLDEQEKTFDTDMENRIGETIERAIKDTTRFLIQNGSIDLTVSELTNMYSDDTGTGDPSVYGFVTFRTLNNLRDMTKAYYICFGKGGIKSNNYRKAIDGLCGIGLTWDKSSKNSTDPKKTKISKDYFTAIGSAINDIEKMSLSKFPEYEKYFNSTTEGIKEMDIPLMQALINKLSEMKKDPDLKVQDLERPLDSEVIKRVCKASIETIKNSISKINITSTDLLSEYTKETIVGYVNTWNILTDLLNSVGEFVLNDKMGYKEVDAQNYKDTLDNIKTAGYKLRSIKKLLNIENPAIAKLIPELKKFNN